MNELRFSHRVWALILESNTTLDLRELFCIHVYINLRMSLDCLCTLFVSLSFASFSSFWSAGPNKAHTL